MKTLYGLKDEKGNDVMLEVGQDDTGAYLFVDIKIIERKRKFTDEELSKLHEEFFGIPICFKKKKKLPCTKEEAKKLMLEYDDWLKDSHRPDFLDEYED